MTRECCDEPTEDCGSGEPASCNPGCAAVLVPYYLVAGRPCGAGRWEGAAVRGVQQCEATPVYQCSCAAGYTQTRGRWAWCISRCARACRYCFGLVHVSWAPECPPVHEASCTMPRLSAMVARACASVGLLSVSDHWRVRASLSGHLLGCRCTGPPFVRSFVRLNDYMVSAASPRAFSRPALQSSSSAGTTVLRLGAGSATTRPRMRGRRLRPWALPRSRRCGDRRSAYAIGGYNSDSS